MAQKLFTSFTVVESQFPPSWFRPKIGLLPGVTIPAFMQFIVLIRRHARDLYAWLVNQIWGRSKST